MAYETMAEAKARRVAVRLQNEQLRARSVEQRAALAARVAGVQRQLDHLHLADISTLLGLFRLSSGATDEDQGLSVTGGLGSDGN